MRVKTKSKKVNKAWLNAHVNDPYVRRAQKDGFRSRAAYKLMQIDEEMHLLRPGMIVVDLGCAPGAWSQYVRRKLAPHGAASGKLNGRIIALDLLPMEPIEDVLFLQGDFRDEDTAARLQTALNGQKADAIISDMAPNLSGIASSDAARIAHLIELAIDFSRAHLNADGILLTKIFHGSGYSQSVCLFKDYFRRVREIKPPASREHSAETFILGQGLKKVGNA